MARRQAPRHRDSPSSPTTLLSLFVLVYPTAWVFVASFRTPETMFASGRHIYTLDNYRSLLSSEFSRAIFNSLFVCIVSVLVSTAVAVVASYAFSRIRFRRQVGPVRLGHDGADISLDHSRHAALHPVR